MPFKQSSHASMGQNISSPKHHRNSTQIFFTKGNDGSILLPVAYDGAWWGMLCLAVALLSICALLAGLTLAVCGLDKAVLQLRSVTGTPRQRQQALVVLRLKRHHTWMLCSLIICSVLAGESFPFVIQSLWARPQAWVPIIISTVAIGFFAEIAPQYWVPQHAIEWGYYCWPIIWGCMWISCVLSWPLAKILEYCSSGRERELTIFSNDELAGLIKYHERSEKHGGSLGKDVARVMLGALSLDGHRIGTNFSPYQMIQDKGSRDSDIERAGLAITPSMIVNWSSIKTVDIDESVDQDFVKKVVSWSHSRIPVIGEAQLELAQPGRHPSTHSSWDSRKIFGFLQIKTLIGLKIDEVHDLKTCILVRDLPLYPLPIVMDDMLAYSLLNLFDLGMSRMAVVIRAPPKSRVGEIIISKKPANESYSQPPCWTGTERTNTRIKSHLRNLNAQADFLTMNEILDGTLADIANTNESRRNVVGIRCPEPLGIITFEDIVDTILQKQSRDEKDFYDNDLQKTKGRPGHYGTVSTVREESHEDSAIPAYVPDTHLSFLRSKETNNLRKRNSSNKEMAPATMDGADERSADAESEAFIEKSRKDTESSYTQNSRGGFHGACPGSSSCQSSVMMTTEELAVLGNGPPTAVNPESQRKPRTVSLPSRNATFPIRSGDWNPYTRRYVSAMPVIPGFRRITPFSRQDYSGFDGLSDRGADKDELMMPKPSMDLIESPLYPQFEVNTFGLEISLINPYYAQLDGNASGIDITDSLDCRLREVTREARREETGDYLSESSFDYGDQYDIDALNSRSCSTGCAASRSGNIRVSQPHSPATRPATNHQHPAAEVPREEPYGGFPPELLDQAQENQVPVFVSKTMPRLMGQSFRGAQRPMNQRGSETRIKENSFHDDRALLPSQRRALNGSAGGMGLDGLRRTSLWF